jgi:S1-C subfamily serine protease
MILSSPLDEISVRSTAQMRDLIEHTRPSIVEVIVRSGSGQWARNGTGFAVSSTGLIATCHHVINGWAEVGVTLSSGETYKATLKSDNVRADVAVLHTGVVTHPLPLGSFSQATVGEEAVWCGFPMYSWLASYHRGMVTFAGEIPMGGAMMEGLQLDGTVNKGNSGGPIIDPRDQRVIGIVGATLGRIDEKVASLKQRAKALNARGTGMTIGGVNPMVLLVELIDDVERLIQLGVGYGISVDYLQMLLRE